HAARGTTPLIRRRQEHVRVGVRHGDVIRAGLVVDLEHLLPGSTAVRRLVDTALSARSKQRAGRRDEHTVVVARVDDDAPDVLRAPEADELERLAAVGRLVDAFAPRRALSVIRLARTDPDDVRILLRHGDGANREKAAILKERREGRAITGRLPHAAVGGA